MAILRATVLWCLLALACAEGIDSTGRLIQNDWKTLEEGTIIRYFNPAKYYPNATEEEIWHHMGDSLFCRVKDDLSVELAFPAGFDAARPFKFVTHGFSSTVIGEKTAFVSAWMETADVNVVLLDWSGLAFIGQITDWDSYSYDSAARNAIDIGEYLGHCLAALTDRLGVAGADIHLVGHSLGAHLMGKAGRVYANVTGQRVGRITGLDPAGPRFVDGPIESALPELHANRLSPESAAFVDVIHTDGSLTPAGVWIDPRFGDLHPLGHLDFYPAGGVNQPGCEFGGPDYLPLGICHHKRASPYFLHSIWEPGLFPAQACADAVACSQGAVLSEEVVAFMGQPAQTYYTGERQLFFVNIEDHHWSYHDHRDFDRQLYSSEDVDFKDASDQDDFKYQLDLAKYNEVKYQLDSSKYDEFKYLAYSHRDFRYQQSEHRENFRLFKQKSDHKMN